MPTKKSHQKLPKKRKMLVFASLLGLLIWGVFSLFWVGYYQQQRYANSLDQAELAPVREQVVNGLNGTMLNAPVDAKTGDIYFPEARLYIGSTASPVNLKYDYDSEQRQLTITDAAIITQQISNLYSQSTSNTEELFTNLPKVQACQRGFTLTESPILPNQDVTLQKTIRTDDGRTYSIFLEDGCPELKATLRVIETIKSY